MEIELEKETELEIYNFPAFKWKYGVARAIQLYADKKPALVFGSLESSDEKVLFEYLTVNRIPFERIHELEDVIIRTDVRIKTIVPRLEGEKYKVCGIGRAYIDQKIMEFHGVFSQSFMYSIKHDKEFNKLIEKVLTKDGWKYFEDMKTKNL